MNNAAHTATITVNLHDQGIYVVASWEDEVIEYGMADLADLIAELDGDPDVAYTLEEVAS